MQEFLMIAVIGVGFWQLARWLSAPRERRREAPPEPAEQPPPAVQAGPGERRHTLTPRGMENLMLLHLELGEPGADADAKAHARETLEAVWRAHLAAGRLAPGTDEWASRREEAWRMLVARVGSRLGDPPWREAPSAVSSPEPLSWDIEPEDAPPPTAPPAVAPAPVVPALTPETRAVVYEPRARAEQSAPAEPVEAAGSTAHFALTPHAPSLMERALASMMRWPRLAAPFLAQNVGWFIGGFCFVAGTLFLVFQTSGLSNALAVLGSLVLYTGALLWGGYQLRRRRPELTTASAVLLGIAMVLIPLDLSAVANLLETSAGSTGARILALGASLLAVAGAFYGARLATGLMDRALPARHAGIFVALGALQLAAPVFADTGTWPWLAAAHLLIVALLGYALVSFSARWVQTIFVDRRRIAWYGAGVLVFAALVSFAHLTWRFDGAIPDGYSGPFIMLLAGLLFHLDASLKTWAKRYPYLSRFTFAVYALTIVAVVPVYDAPVPRALTLALAAVGYGLMVRQYLTATPLYLLLASLAGLYFTVVLEPLRGDLWLLAAIPGLAILAYVERRLRRRHERLARSCTGAFTAASLALGAFSLGTGQAGLVACATAVLTGACLLYGVRAHADQWPEHLRAAGSYGALALLAAASLLAPEIPGISRGLGTAGLLLALAGCGAWLAGLRRVERGDSEILLNGTLLSSAAALAVAAHSVADGHTGLPALAALLAVAGALFAWVGVANRVRAPLYLAMACLAGTGVIVKQVYFPGPSTGLAEMAAALLLWAALRWLERPPSPERIELEALQAARREPLTLLWHLSASRA